MTTLPNLFEILFVALDPRIIDQPGYNRLIRPPRGDPRHYLITQSIAFDPLTICQHDQL
jgi:hypothetical protein